MKNIFFSFLAKDKNMHLLKFHFFIPKPGDETCTNLLLLDDLVTKLFFLFNYKIGSYCVSHVILKILKFTANVDSLCGKLRKNEVYNLMIRHKISNLLVHQIYLAVALSCVH